MHFVLLCFGATADLRTTSKITKWLKGARMVHARVWISPHGVYIDRETYP